MPQSRKKSEDSKKSHKNDRFSSFLAIFAKNTVTMIYILIIAVALLPVAVLLWYIYKHDPVPEPIPMLKKAFLYGMMMCIPISVAEMIMQFGIFGNSEPMPTSFIGAAVDSFFVAGLVEESFKLLALWLVIRHNRFFDEHFDGIVYAVYVSLGFAAIENVMYLFSNSSDWFSVGIARALLAVPGHYAFGVLMGYYYSMYYFVNRSTYNRVMILAAPIVAHGIYDTIAFSMGLSEGLASVLMVGLCVFCYYLHKNAQKKLISHINRDTNPFDHYQG